MKDGKNNEKTRMVGQIHGKFGNCLLFTFLTKKLAKIRIVAKIMVQHTIIGIPLFVSIISCSVSSPTNGPNWVNFEIGRFANTPSSEIN